METAALKKELQLNELFICAHLQDHVANYEVR